MGAWPSLRPMLALEGRRFVRALPFPALVAVSVGQDVSADTVIVRGAPPQEPLVVPLAAILGVHPHDLPRHLNWQTGQAFQRGDILARRGGLLARTYRAPFAGTLARIMPQRGAVALMPASEEVALTAHLAGTVERLLPGRGAVVRARGLLSRPLTCAGAEAHGRLVARGGAHEPLAASAFDEECRGAVVLVGSLRPGARSAAAARGVAAVIAASAQLEALDDPSDWSPFAPLRAGPLGRSLGPPDAGPVVAVLHAIGATPAPAAVHAALAALVGRTVSILHDAPRPGGDDDAPLLWVAGPPPPAVVLPPGVIVAGDDRGRDLAAIDDDSGPAAPFGPLRGLAVRVRFADGTTTGRLPAWCVERWPAS